MGGRLLVMRRVLRNRGLRRVELAFLGFGAAEYGVWVAVLVFAYQHGGTGMAAAIAAVQLIPAAVLAPLAGELALRRGRDLTLAASYWAQAIALLCTAAAFLFGAPAAIGYLGATVAAMAVTLTRPAQAALVPQLVHTPSELTAANVASAWVESTSMLIGPALAGALIAIHGAGLAVLAFGSLLAACAVLATGLDRGAGRAGALVTREGIADGDLDVPGLIRTCLHERSVVVLLGLFLIEFIALGALDVLVVVLALAQFHLGSAGAGYLQAMFGAGAVLGATGAVALVGHRTLATPLLIAAGVWGVSLLAMAGWASAVAAFVLLAVAGASRTVFEAAGRTLLHRAVAPQIHGRAFGVLEGVEMAGLAVGSLAVPGLIAAGGTAAALVAIGAALSIGSVAAVAALGDLADGLAVPETVIALLRRGPLFVALGLPVLEDLARGLTSIAVAPGESVVREGEPGDRYYLVAAGELVVSVGGREIRRLHESDGFGEIALLRDGIRTATVTARGPATVHSLARIPFLDALGASRHARVAAEAVLAEYVGPAAAV